jgi:hypothetical protein
VVVKAVKRLLAVGAALVVGCVALVVGEALRSLRQSRPDDVWSPHRKGF